MANRRFIDFPIATTVGDSDIILIWQSGVNKQTTKATFLSGLPENLDELNDVAISGLTNGQILRYDSVTGKWENTDQGNLDLNDLNDVSIVSPTNGQVLVYNSSTSKWENSSGGFVPYTGAVTTVDLGAQGLRAGYIRFDTSVVSVPDEQGLVYWDQSRSTAALIMNGVLQHIGQDVFYYVKNSTGSSIAKGTAVRFDGTDGASGHVKIAPFLANGTYPSNYFVGVTAETIANGAFGQVMHFGELDGINTSGYTAGDLLYASTTTAGAFQTTAPVAPNNIVLIAAAINSKNNGTILVRPTYGSNINQDEGVKITTPTTGDLLQLQAGGLWENKAVATVMSNYVTLDTGQTITGQKFFANNTLTLNTTGNANSTILTNSSGASTYQSGRNFFGFNTDNHIYFAKSSNTGVNTGILAWTNTATRTYTLPDASGTIALVGGAGVGTVTSVAALTLGTSGTDLNSTVANSTTTPVITLNVPTASATNRGALSSSDWTTFNNKQNALTNPVTGTGASGRVAYFTGSTSIGGEDALFWDSTNNRLGIGTTIPTNPLHIVSNEISQLNIQALSGNTNAQINLEPTGTGIALIGPANNVDFAFRTNATERMRITSGGNLLVGTTTDAGFKLDVNGTGRFSGNGFFGNATAFAGLAGGISVNGSTNSGINFRIADVLRGYVYVAGNLGMYVESTAGNVVLAPTGVAALTATTSGNVGIGTTSPTDYSSAGFTTLHINGRSGTGGGVLRLTSFDAACGVNFYAQSNTVVFNTTTASPYAWLTQDVTRMTLTSSGNVLIGTTTDGGQRLQVSGTSRFTNNMDIGTSSTNNILMYAAGSNNPSVGVYGGAGSNSANGAASLNVVDFTNNRYWQIQIDGSSQLATFYYNGSVWSKVGYQTTGGTWTNSDERRKENIEISKYGLNEVLQLIPKKFNYKLDERKIKNLGFIAQDVIDLIPESVQTDIDGQKEYYAMNYSNLVPVLVKAIQELNQKFDNLKN